MTSSNVCCWFPILSNSSIQHVPLCEHNKAPASNVKSSPDSLLIATVKPADVVVLPQTNTPLGETFAQEFKSWLLPRPGSPTTKTCVSLLTTWTLFCF